MTIEASPTSYSRKARAAELASPWIVLRTSRSNGGLETCSTERRQTKKEKNKTPSHCFGKGDWIPRACQQLFKELSLSRLPKARSAGWSTHVLNAHAWPQKEKGNVYALPPSVLLQAKSETTPSLDASFLFFVFRGARLYISREAHRYAPTDPQRNQALTSLQGALVVWKPT